MCDTYLEGVDRRSTMTTRKPNRSQLVTFSKEVIDVDAEVFELSQKPSVGKGATSGVHIKRTGASMGVNGTIFYEIYCAHTPPESHTSWILKPFKKDSVHTRRAAAPAIE